MRTVWLKLALAMLLGLVAAFTTYDILLIHKSIRRLTREQFLAEVRAGHVRKVLIEDEKVIESSSSTRGAFATPYDKSRDAQLILELRARGVEVVFTKSPAGLI